MSHDTLERRIREHNLPSNHIVKRLDGRGFVISTDKCDTCDRIDAACKEYHRRTPVKKAEIAAEMAVKYDIDTVRLFRVLGITNK